MPADIDPSPITAIARPGWSLSLFATAKPSAALIEVDECAAPKGSYSLSLRLVKPDSPPPVLSVRIRSRRPGIGRASCRDRGGRFVLISGVAGSLKKKKEN